MRVLSALAVITAALAAAPALQQPAGQPPPAPAATTPPPDNNQSLRKLSPDEIPPNLSFYAIDPLYTPGVPLGWAAKEVRERLDRGVIAVAAADGRTHLSWRLLQADPPDVTFNVYRSVASGKEMRLNAQPIRTTTDYGRRRPPGAEQCWRVLAIVNGREARRRPQPGVIRPPHYPP